MKTRLLLGIIVSTALAAPALAQSVPADAASRVGTLAIVTNGRCSSATEAGFLVPLIGAAAGIFGDFLTGWASRKLEAHRDGKSASWVASGVANLAAGAGRDLCLAVGRTTMTPTLFATPAGEIAVTRARLRNSSPDFYYEADLRSTAVAGSPGFAWTLAPHLIHYRATSAPSGGKVKHTSVVVALSNTTPPAGTVPADSAAIGVFRHDFGKLDVGRTYKRPLLVGTDSAATFTPTAAVNITALVTESEKAGPALEAFIGAFNSNKDALSKVIEDAVKGALGGGS